MRDVSYVAGGDGIVRIHVKLSGFKNNKPGEFYWIIEPDGTINHRIFETNPKKW